MNVKVKNILLSFLSRRMQNIYGFHIKCLFVNYGKFLCNNNYLFKHIFGDFVDVFIMFLRNNQSMSFACRIGIKKNLD